MADESAEKRTRGQGRGGNFFALGQDVWQRLWTIDTTNRLNLIIAYLVLLAGTGSDHRLTKWSAKACEEHTGLGKPRAKRAIEELIAGGLVRRSDSSTRMMPQYELPVLPIDAEPIFLPVALVTGLAGETPILRRVRETGDPMLARMLIDLYGLITLDAPYGVSIECLRGGGNPNNEPTARKIAEVGSHAVWALNAGTWRNGGGDWAVVHRQKGKADAAWRPLWERVDMLKQIGALWFEPWVYDGEGLDAEPLIPINPAGFYAVAAPDDEAKLTRLAFEVSHALVGEEREYVFDRNEGEFFLPLTLHRQTPAIRHVARLRVEADTPGRRLAWRKRRIAIERHLQGFDQLLHDVKEGRFDRPMRLPSIREAISDD